MNQELPVNHESSARLVGGLNIAYQCWAPNDRRLNNHVPAALRILCLPGWLDNSGSFEPIGPYFARAGYTIVCIDPPGCGKSAHRSRIAWYNDFEECVLLAQFADEIGWDSFIMCGHSRGSNIGLTMSGAFRHRVLACIVYDGGLGTAGTYISHKIGYGTFSNALSANEKNSAKQPRQFDTLDEAYEHNRDNVLFPKSHQVAKPIVDRHIRETEDGKFVFTHDVRTYGQYQTRYIDAGLNIEFLKALYCPVLHIVASSSGFAEVLKDQSFGETAARYIQKSFIKDPLVIPGYIRELQERISAIRNYTGIILTGRHHLHGDIPQICFEATHEWLRKQSILTQLPMPVQDMRHPEYSLLDHIYACASDAVCAKCSSCTCSCYDEVLDGDHLLPEENCICIEELQLAYQAWGDRNASQKFIAWSDPLDNSGSFDSFAARFASRDIFLICVDSPGSGLSHQVPKDYRLSISEQADILFRIANAFEWTTFSVLGHLRGAAVVAFAAGAFPERISRVILLNPWFDCTPDIWGPSEMFYAYQENLVSSLPTFSNLSHFVSCLSLDPLLPKAWGTAMAIAKRRCVMHDDGQWRITDDPKIFARRQAVVGISETTWKNTADGIHAPVLIIRPSQHMSDPLSDAVVGKIKNARFLSMPGGSHWHSDCAKEAVDIVNGWMASYSNM